MDGEPDMMGPGSDVQDSSKRTASTADLDDVEQSTSRLKKKARLRDPITTKWIDESNDDLEELEFLQTRLRPKRAFRRPPSPPNLQQRHDFESPDTQQREKILRSSQSQIGDNQDEPLVLEDDEGPDQTSGPQVDIDNQDNPLVLEDDEGPDRDSGSEVDITSPKEGQDQRTSTPNGGQGQRDSVSHREEWEIEKIVGKRRTRRGYEYKVRWQDTWLLESELGNAQELLQRFDVEHGGNANRGR